METSPEERGKEPERVPMLWQSRPGRLLFLLTVLFCITCAGFYFRYTYARSSSPYIDEYTTMWVALRTLRLGYPVFTTGALYTQGLLLTYVEALLFRLCGFSEFIARIPSLIVSVLSIPLLFVLGKRLFPARVGLIAAALLAFDPQAIGWGGRARGYGLLPFFVVFMVLATYEGVIVGDKALYRRLQLLFFLAAVYVHIGAGFFFPALVLVGLLWRGWRWFLRPVVLVEHLLVVLGLASSFYLYRLMRPEGWTSLGEGRPAFAPSLNVLGAAQRYAPFFLGPDQLPFVALITLFLLAGFAYCFVKGWRKRGKGVLALHGEDTGLAFLCVTFFVVMTQMLFVVGERRWSTRYLFMLAPLFFLIASSMLVKFLDLVAVLPTKGGLRLPLSLTVHSPYLWRPAIAGLVTVFIALFALPTSLAAANRQEFGYDLAFKYVSGQRRDGDEVMSFDLSACMLYLDEQCDYVAVEKDFHAYATKRGEDWIGAWGGVPVLFTDAALERAIEEADRMWFVVDERRFRARYTDDFVQYVWDRAELVAKERGVFVFLAESPPAPALPSERALFYNLGEKVALLGYGLSSDTPEAGDVLRLSLRWQGLTHILESYSVFVHVVDPEGVMWTQHDGVPLNGLHPTTHWVAGEIISDPRELTLPADTPSGRYRVEVGLYRPDTMQHLPVMDEQMQPVGERIVLDYIRVGDGSPEALVPQNASSFSLDNRVTLWGYDVEPLQIEPGGAVGVVLYWQAEQLMDEDYTVFVHLVDEGGRIWGQEDREPEGGFYHTSFWEEGEVVRDEYEFAIDPETPPGKYQIEAGMYVPASGQRLPVVDGSGQIVEDRMLLGTVEVAG